jgi:hypothetical protein
MRNFIQIQPEGPSTNHMTSIRQKCQSHIKQRKIEKQGWWNGSSGRAPA